LSLYVLTFSEVFKAVFFLMVSSLRLLALLASLSSATGFNFGKKNYCQ